MKMRELLQNGRWFPSSILRWCVLPMDQNFLDSAMAQLMLPGVLVYFLLEPNGSLFIQFRQCSLNSTIVTHKFLQTLHMKHWVDLGGGWEFQFVCHWTNTLKNMIGAIKFWCNFLVALSFEISLLIRLKTNGHLVTYLKNPLRTMLLFLFLHMILSHDEFFFECSQRKITTLKQVIHYMDFIST